MTDIFESILRFSDHFRSIESLNKIKLEIKITQVLYKNKERFHKEDWNLKVRSEKDRCSKIHSKHATCRQCQSSQQGRQNRLCGRTCSFCLVVYPSRVISPSLKRDGAIQLSVPTTENFTFLVDIKVIARSNNQTLNYSPFSSQ